MLIKWLSAVMVALMLAVGLSACGGGGGGGSGGGSGDFTVSRSSLNFSGAFNRPYPDAQTIRMTINDRRAAFVGAAYTQGRPAASWLEITITGTGSTFDAAFRITSNLTPGTYTAVPSLGYADENGNILASRDITVTYVVAPVLTAVSTPLSGQRVFGSSDSSVQRQIAVDADGVTWRATSSAPWLQVAAGPYSGNRQLEVTLDATGLAIGDYSASISLSNDNLADNTVTVPVSFSVSAPTLSAGPASLLFGGADGVDATPPQALGFAVDTGSNLWPWTLTLSTSSGGNWLAASVLTGTVGAAGSSTAISVDPAPLVGGVYQGIAELAVDINGTVLRYLLPVRLNKEVERLQVATDGVAFTLLPSRQLLSRDIGVSTSLGRNGVPWTATSSENWLDVTASGVTGQPLRLSVTPGLLLPNRTHMATVTVSTRDPTLVGSEARTETIRVGFWRSGVDPQRVSMVSAAQRLVTSPIAPLLYSHDGGNLVTVRNLFSGDVVSSYPIGTEQPGAMVLSSDGARLYVVDLATHRVLARDAGNGGAIASYPYVDTAFGSSAELAYARTSAVPTLILGNGTVINLESGDSIADAYSASGLYDAGPVGVSADGRDIYVPTGASPSFLIYTRMSWSSFDGLRLIATRLATSSSEAGGFDVAVAADGSRVYGAGPSPYSFPVFDSHSLVRLGELTAAAYPNNAEASWNGLFAGGADAQYAPADVWFYAADGSSRGTLQCAGAVNYSLQRFSLRLSGDGFRYSCVTASIFTPGDRNLVFGNAPAP